MLLLGKLRLEIFVDQHEDSRIPLSAWQLEAEEAAWMGPEQVQEHYVDAVVSNDRLQFCFKSIYKLDVKARFKEGVLFVEKVWTTKISKASRSAAIVKSAARRRKA